MSNDRSDNHREEIAIIGMAGRFPGARNVDEFWHNLLNGVESIRSFTKEELKASGVDDTMISDPSFVNSGAVMDEADAFDASFFGISAREAEIMDPQHRVFLETAWNAMENAGYEPEGFNGLIGLFGGVAPSTYFQKNILTRPDLLKTIGNYATMIASEREYAITRVGYKLNLKGPCVSINTACSTSGVAIHLACQSVLSGECDMALAGGARIRVPMHSGYLYIEDGILSPDGHCRAFDSDARGTVIANGVSLIVLKRLSEAIHDGDSIYAVIKGTAVNNDGLNKIGFTAPSVLGQAAVISEALDMADVSPHTIGYVEAHGTGTSIGDPIEISALTKAFSEKTKAKGFCPIGSLKTNIGHLDAAAGVTGVIKTALSLKHKLIPPSLNFKAPNPQIDFGNSPFYVNKTLSKWPDGKQPRRAGVSTFGLGGTNAHIILEEAPQTQAAGNSRPYQLICLSAKSENALEEATVNFVQHLKASPGICLPNAAFTLQIGRRRFQHRRMLVCHSVQNAIEFLEPLDQNRVNTLSTNEENRPVVFIFPGEGAQYVNMALDLYKHEEAFREIVDTCCAILNPQLEVDIRNVLYPSKDTADKTVNELEKPSLALPTLFTIEYALARLWISWGIQPSAMIGHSVGEYVAACLAGAISLEDALAIVTLRGRLFEKLPAGEMPRAPLSEQAANEFHQFLETVQFTPPSVPYISSVTGSWITAKEVQDPSYWVKHLRQTSTFSEGLHVLLQEHEGILLEVGPGQTLSTVARQHSTIPHNRVAISSLRHPHETTHDMIFLLTSLGRLWLAGAHINWPSFYSRENRQRVPLPTYPFEKKRYWIEPRISLSPTETVNETLAPKETGSVSLTDQQQDINLPGQDADKALPKTRKENIILKIKKIVNELSGVDVTAIDGNATFLELGFDSLMLTQLNADFQKIFGVKITFRQLSETAQTSNALADFIDSQLSPEAFSNEAGDALTDNVAQTAPPSQAISTFDSQEGLFSAMQAMGTEDAHVSHQGFGPWKPIKKRSESSLTAQKKDYLSTFIEKYYKRTKSSKLLAQKQRPHLADPRAVTGFNADCKEMVYQIAVSRSAGSKIWDIDDNEYVDLTMGFGINLFGHSPSFIRNAVEAQLKNGFELGINTPLAEKVAKLICELTKMDRVTLVNTGSEAVMAAIRAARTVTLRDKIAVFKGDYHGISDEVLVRSITVNGIQRTMPAAPGIPPAIVENVIILDDTDPHCLDILNDHGPELAAVVVEPVQSRNPNRQPRNMLQHVRKITEDQGIALIFDELITGFRLHVGGAQEFYGVKADIAAYGKILSGGLPMAAVAGRSRFMDAFDGGIWDYGDTSRPEAGVTFFGGTFVKHPLSLSASLAALEYLKQQGPDLHKNLNRVSSKFAQDVNDVFDRYKIDITLEHCGSMFYFVFPDGNDFDRLLLYHLREKGVYIGDRPFFLSTAHSQEDLAFVIQALQISIEELQTVGFLSVKETDFKSQAAPSQLPLTESQKEIWLATCFGDDRSRSYNLSFSLDLKGPLNPDALQWAVQQVVKRHAALRTTFNAGGEHQKTNATPSIDLPFIDFSDNPDISLAKATEFQNNQLDVVFDLTSGPLLKIFLIKIAAYHYRLMLITHHIICDGWSLTIVTRDLANFYSAACQNITTNLRAPMQFHEFVDWQAAQENTQETSETKAYWHAQFSDGAPVLDLPYDRPRPPIKTYNASREQLAVGKSLYESVKSFSAKHGCTLFTTMLAVGNILIHRLSGQDDIVMGISTAGQTLVGRDDLVGHCVNMLPIRSQVKGQPSFLDYLAYVKKILFDAFDHRNFTYGMLLKELNIPRDPSRLPLISVIFNLDPVMKGLDFHDLDAQVSFNPRKFENFDLFFNGVESGDNLMLECSYNTDLFNADTIRRWLAHFRTLLESIIAKPEVSIDRLPLLTETAQRSLIHEWNETEAVYPESSCLHHLIEDQARRNPDKTAVVFGSQHLSYAGLNERANQLAHFLEGEEIGPDTFVGICLERSIEMVIGVLGILKAGGAYLPLDPDYPAERLSYMLEDSAAPILLCQSSLQERLPSHTLKTICLDRDREAIAGHSKENPAVKMQPQNLAYIIYTSGSTGKPKGVQVPHGTVVNFLTSMAREPGLTETDVLLAVTTLSFDIHVLEIYLPLIVGARVVVAGREEVADGALLVRALQEQKITVMQATPGTWRLLLAAGWEGSQGFKVLCGGEALPRDLLRELQPRVGSFWNMYGPTETTVWSSCCRITDAEAPILIGRPIANTQIYVLDRLMQPLPIGVPGELCIGGDGVTRGYLKRPELTAKQFVPDPFRSDPAARLYKTGDLARFLADGSLECLSRIDSQVKVRGFRIELGEIESALSEYAGVEECVTAVREDRPGDVRLVGYIVPGAGTEVKVADLRSHLRSKLPDYMVPQHFVELAELPLTPAGKVDRKHLPAPDSDDFLSASEYVAPHDTIELQLTKLWEKHLGITPISVNDNFFDIGGHSLLAVQLFIEIEKTIGKRLPLATLFKAQSISELASIFRQKDWKPNWSSLVAIQPGGSKPPLFLVHGAGGNVLLYRDLARNLGKDQPVFGLQSQGLNSKQEFLTTIEEMASYYITEIRTLQPKGPYYLGGYCLGGQIAFEIARQLVNANQKVLFVGMFDTQREWVQNLTQITSLYQYYQNIAFHFKNFLLANNQGKKAFIKEKCFESLRRIKRRIDVSISIVCFRMNLRNERPLAIMEHINDKAAQQYVAKPYSGRITLFQPKRPYAGYEDPYYGWNDNFADTIDIQKLTMYPAGMLVEPFVQELTDKLSVCLEQARQDSNPVKLNARDVKRKV